MLHELLVLFQPVILLNPSFTCKQTQIRKEKGGRRNEDGWMVCMCMHARGRRGRKKEKETGFSFHQSFCR
jgi:hypothetical protein